MSRESGERLDRYLVRRGLAPSRRAARDLTRQGAVLVNGRRLTKGALVSERDRVEVTTEAAAAIEPDHATHLDIVFEDSSVVVVNKPGLMPCHPLRPGEIGTVMNALAACRPETAFCGDNALEGGLCHRLDNGTSGALIVARSAAVFGPLRDAIRAGRVLRRYQAMIAGDLGHVLDIDLPIAHHPKNARKMVTVAAGALPHRRSAKPALTRVEPIRRVGRFTRVWVMPASGRRHQIRVHLKAAGYPLLGDTLYGGPASDALEAGRFWLHLYEVYFDSPATGPISVKVPVPAELLDLSGGS